MDITIEELENLVPEEVADDFDPGYDAVEDPNHGNDEVGDIPDDEVNDA